MENEYYIIGRENNENYPLLRADENVDYEYEIGQIQNPQKMEYVMRRPIPKRPVFVDYHKSPKSIISQKVYEVLNHFNLFNTQFIQAILRGKTGEAIGDYWYLHIFNSQEVMDKEKSVFQWMETIQTANPIERLVLDERRLSSVPLAERLVFRLKENSTFEIFHQSVVEAIMATDPKGMKFTKVKDYHI